RGELVAREHEALDGVELVQRELVAEVCRARLQREGVGRALLAEGEGGAEHELFHALRAALDVAWIEAVCAQLFVAGRGGVVASWRRRARGHGAAARPRAPRERRDERARG